MDKGNLSQDQQKWLTEQIRQYQELPEKDRSTFLWNDVLDEMLPSLSMWAKSAITKTNKGREFNHLYIDEDKDESTWRFFLFKGLERIAERYDFEKAYPMGFHCQMNFDYFVLENQNNPDYFQQNDVQMVNLDSMAYHGQYLVESTTPNELQLMTLGKLSREQWGVTLQTCVMIVQDLSFSRARRMIRHEKRWTQRRWEKLKAIFYKTVGYKEKKS